MSVQGMWAEPLTNGREGDVSESMLMRSMV